MTANEGAKAKSHYESWQEARDRRIRTNAKTKHYRQLGKLKLTPPWQWPETLRIRY